MATGASIGLGLPSSRPTADGTADASTPTPTTTAAHPALASTSDKPHPADLLSLEHPEQPSRSPSTPVLPVQTTLPPRAGDDDDVPLAQVIADSPRRSSPRSTDGERGPALTVDTNGITAPADAATSPTTASGMAEAKETLRGRGVEMGQPVDAAARDVSTGTTSSAASSPRTSRRSPDASTDPSPATSSPAAPPTRPVVQSTSSRRQLGEWTMGKTLGAGSMGKVKLAVSNKTGEKMAIKIIPRYTSTAAAHQQAAERKSGDRKRRGSQGDTTATASGTASGESTSAPTEPTASFLAKAHAKDVSKEVRTIREAAIVLLLHHPYICGMRSMLVYPHHYYMIFEYVNGGQMLDYIISHGRLRERSARKFARQIGSSLEYAHANSIVHRDLKIENILISKTGNIKIIDFGLSNLWSPHANLSTFCGSLYFAAPELLNARAYTGPEVDVWSFGIVLYVLVCGKVPFDDQSMPALHAKIKRGQVEYPAWLSSECKHILSRMLVTNPAHRITLPEVLAHPWMTKGFEGPPSSHLPHREPIRAGQLESHVIKGMTGFEFGAVEDIETKLNEVLTSASYLTALRAYDLRRGVGFANPAEHAALTRAMPVGSASTSSASSRPLSPTMNGHADKLGRSPSKRFSGLDFYRRKIGAALGGGAGTSNGAKTPDEPLSPTAESPDGLTLRNGVRADSLDPTRGFHPLLSIYYLVREKIERERIYGAGVFASSTLSVNGPPLPPAPAAAYQATGPAPVVTPPPTLRTPPSAFSASPPQAIAMSPQSSATPRPRATNDDYADMGGDGGEASRRQSLALNRRSAVPRTIAASAPTTPAMGSGFRPSIDQTSAPAPPPTAADKRTSLQLAPPAAAAATSKDMPRQSLEVNDDDRPLSAPSGTFARRFGSILGRSVSGSDSDYSRRAIRQRNSVSGASFRPSATTTTASGLPQVDERSGAVIPSVSVSRANTVQVDGSPRRGHLRGQSQTVGRADSRAVSLAMSANAGGVGVVDEQPEDVTVPADELATSPSEQVKPIYLKGLFSVATTSTKPVQQIRDDLVRVLDRLGVRHRALKTGFECVHAPSIDLASVGSPRPNDSASLMPSPTTPNPGSSVKRRASRLGITRSPRSKDRDLFTGPDSETSMPDAGPASESSLSAPGPSSSSRPPAPANASSDLVIQFEITLIKVPWLPGFHGLQFRRTAGNAFTYSMLARTVLRDLRL